MSRQENVSNLMQKVQNLSWSPFKLNEIVTLEKCLQEAALSDPKIALILKKLANECVFVEPRRKANYLQRGDDEKKAQKELEREALLMMDEVAKLNKQIDYFNDKLEDLSNGGEKTRLQIIEVEKKISLLSCPSELPCQLDLAVSSFDRSIEAIKFSIPDFIASLSQSNLIKQFDSLPSQYRSCLISIMRACRSEQQQVGSQSHRRELLLRTDSLLSAPTCSNDLKRYLITLTSLYRDLVKIDKLYSTRIPEELEHLEALRTHLDYLKKPLADAPKLTTVVHYNCSSHLHTIMDLCGAIEEPCEKREDVEWGEMTIRLMDRMRLINNL